MIAYNLLLFDFAVLNNRVSAYVLVCARMMPELAYFIIALFFSIFIFASSFSCMMHHNTSFDGIGVSTISLWELMMGYFLQSKYRVIRQQWMLLVGTYAFLVMATLFVTNTLIAQLSCAYDRIYADMLGYARLKRIRITNDTMPKVSRSRWDAFVQSLKLDEPVEFNEGDLGLSGGIQLLENASLNPTTADAIRRYGGSTSPKIPWPEDESWYRIELSKLEYMETALRRATGEDDE